MLIAPILPTPERWKPESSLSAPEIESRPPGHMSEHVSERLTPQPIELARLTKTVGDCC